MKSIRKVDRERKRNVCFCVCERMRVICREKKNAYPTYCNVLTTKLKKKLFFRQNSRNSECTQYQLGPLSWHDDAAADDDYLLGTNCSIIPTHTIRIPNDELELYIYCIEHSMIMQTAAEISCRSFSHSSISQTVVVPSKSI